MISLLRGTVRFADRMLVKRQSFNTRTSAFPLSTQTRGRASSTTTPPRDSIEVQLRERLSHAFPDATSVDVQDVSGGCGAMFEIAVISPKFKGLSIIKQHKLVTEVLKEEIKDMHGLRIYTSPD